MSIFRWAWRPEEVCGLLLSRIGWRPEWVLLLWDEDGRMGFRQSGMLLLAGLAGLTLLLAACGGSALSLEEYVERQQAVTDELQALGVQVNTEIATAIDPETGEVIDVAALRGILGGVASTLNDSYEEVADIEPPPEVADAHDAFMEAAASRLEQWETAADRAAGFESVEELATATLKSPAFTEACMALEQAVADGGLQLDMDCD